MATPFHLEVLSPDRTFYTGDCVSLVVPISDGMLGIMAHHAPLTAAVVAGEAAFTLPDGTRMLCAVSQGMVNVSENRVQLLCELALAPDEINAETEQRQAREAMIQLQKKQSHRDFVLAQLTFAKAVNNLRVKRHAEGK